MERRWLNQDPIGELGGLNLYAYVENYPVNRIDPLGLEGGIAEANRGGVNGVPYMSITVGPGGNMSVQNNDDAFTPLAGAFAPLAGGLALGAGAESVAAYGVENTLQILALLAQNAMDAHKNGKKDCPPNNSSDQQPTLGSVKFPNAGRMAKLLNTYPRSVK
jgi:uncharacterized protein RhaS with RHS repeats